MGLNQLDWHNLKPEPDIAQVEAARQREYETDVEFLKTFSAPSGKIVLAWLVAHTLDTPTWWPDADYNKSVANGFFREGQNSLIRQLQAKINNAKNYQEKRKS